MIGKVNESNRALLPVSVRKSVASQLIAIKVWVDTAFDGHFVFAKKLIEELGLESLIEADAMLVDVSIVTLETFVAYLDWFGKIIPVQVVANEGQSPLLGTALLANRRLAIDYAQKTLVLE